MVVLVVVVGGSEILLSIENSLKCSPSIESPSPKNLKRGREVWEEVFRHFRGTLFPTNSPSSPARQKHILPAAVRCSSNQPELAAVWANGSYQLSHVQQPPSQGMLETGGGKVM